MNLDKSCPNPHYMDLCCTCPKPVSNPKDCIHSESWIKDTEICPECLDEKRQCKNCGLLVSRYEKYRAGVLGECFHQFGGEEIDRKIRRDISQILVRWDMPTRQVAISELETLVESTRLQALLEERQFVLNILDGIDKADAEMGGGGTKAIRFALSSRIID